MRELRLLGEIRWCRLVVSRGIAEDIRNGLDIRSVIAPQGQDTVSDGVSYTDAVNLASVWKLRQRLLELRIERWLEVRIQFYEDFVCSRRSRGCTSSP